ncbi:MAG TPA: sulfate/molybdate ABC transporter ATP-binding protein [Vitreimonas sp.]|uniref:sulfate/molybdate ABC transporter ATP-binding protein n=1 Tax=Vitreimonas sp. TaxID=3069702 RepID=UPI002D3DB3EF|nr:sulfate/molybdate ABC transporter ATP-binding protein [Vitreimonas sp.]HYD89467.1 sulfate/molybdate ABC transporter ATP-binding protein [Vitreimonas sp.]
MPLEIANINKSFGRTPVLKKVSLFAEDGEFLALLGPSGSGKTTLLRIIAGLETPDAGAVRFQNEDLLAQPVRQRRIGFVFQHYALFRHMTAAQNVAFGINAKPRSERPSRRETRERVSELLNLVQLGGLENRYPSQLSGGQRQRVALARALAIEPRILLLDEPFGALDAKVRRELRRWLRDLHERTGLTTIFVTHDQEEALDLADRIALLRDGALEQVGTPEELYHEPDSAFVFEFLGDSVRLPCTVQGGVAIIGGAPAPILGANPGDGHAFAYARPDAFNVVSGSGPGLAAHVRNVILAGPDARLDCAIDGDGAIDVRIPAEEAAKFSPRDNIRLTPRTVRVWR